MPGGRPGDPSAVEQLNGIVTRVVQVAANLGAIQLEMVDPAAHVTGNVTPQRQAP